jgi:hypothetical protein
MVRMVDEEVDYTCPAMNKSRFGDPRRFPRRTSWVALSMSHPRTSSVTPSGVDRQIQRGSAADQYAAQTLKYTDGRLEPG